MIKIYDLMQLSVSSIKKLFSFMSSYFLILFLSFCVVSGCAYRFGMVERKVPGGYQFVNVPAFKNQTQEVGIETYFTQSLIRQLERSKVAKVVDSKSAEVIIDGEITRVSFVPRSPIIGTGSNLPSGVVLAAEYQVLVSAKISVRRKSDQSILWEDSIQGQTIYTAPQVGTYSVSSVNALYNHSARHISIESVADEMMEEAHDRLTENF